MEKNDQGAVEIFYNTTMTSPDQKNRIIEDWSRAGVKAETLNKEFVIRPGNHQNGEGYVGWESGRDVDLAGDITNEHSAFTEKARSFEFVRFDFQFCVGQKIGIVVYRDFPIDTASTGLLNTSTDKLEQIYGKINTVNIYGGEITRVVCDDQLWCFEHNINTFPGCSGAVIFLLDKHQDPANGVTEEDYGKAIAIHVGGDDVGEGMVRNFAFRIYH